jgi:chromosome segregation ATPase
LETLCVDCTATINKYTNKVGNLTETMEDEANEIEEVSAQLQGLETAKDLAEDEVSSLEEKLEEAEEAYDEIMGSL